MACGNRKTSEYMKCCGDLDLRAATDLRHISVVEPLIDCSLTTRGVAYLSKPVDILQNELKLTGKVEENVEVNGESRNRTEEDSKKPTSKKRRKSAR